MKAAVILSLIGIALSMNIKSKPDQRIEDEDWQIWKSAQNRKYSSFGEEQARYAIWADNLRRITEHNKKSKSMVLGMNQFGDMTNTEFRKLTACHFPTTTEVIGSTFRAPSNVVVPDEMDWRKKGYVTPVKNQGQCGSCWSFSSTGAIEGQHFNKTGKLVSLSEQNLVDCTKEYGNRGCHGGLMVRAFEYVLQNGGIDTEASYPYYAKDIYECRFNKSNIGATISDIMTVPSGSEEDLKAAVGLVGPVAIAIDATHISFQLYKTGVYYEPKCDPKKLDHAVLAIGYGTGDDGDYWIVKNSWGERWGDYGYIKMTRNKGNQCGIASMASFPLAY